MKLYEINEAIESLTNQMIVDTDTGEIIADVDGIIKKIEGLEMERQEVLQYLAKTVLNLRADQSAIKTEEDRLKSRREAMKKREASIMRVLERECNGEKTDLGVATVKFTPSKSLEVVDASQAIDWLAGHDMSRYIRFPEPEIDKAAVKALMNTGTEVPGCIIHENKSCSLR